MTTEPTPGPWTHYDDSENPQHRHMIAAMGKTIAHIYCTKGDEAADEANARLIAAAPDLLAALKALTEDDQPETWAQAQAAIDKAEGKP